jgi:hypothetical protein
MDLLVSVVVPSYNHAAYLAAAIESVLGQTLRDLELIVVDDGSEDTSLEIARRYAASDPRVRVLTHPGGAHRGIGATANLGRRATRGRYLLGLASDDVLLPDTLEHEVAFLDEHPEVGWVYGNVELIDAAGRPLEQETRHGREVIRYGRDLTAGGQIMEQLIAGNSIPAMTIMWRRECREAVGDEHPSLTYSDWELLTRAASHWGVAFIPRTLALYRVHGANTSLGVARAVTLARRLEVIESLRQRALSVGGRLAEPRIRATIELQGAFMRFASGEEGADAQVRAAFEADPSLAGDARWLGDWLWSRPLDELLPEDGPDFAAWFEQCARPWLEPGAARRLRRAARAASAETRAIRNARRGRALGAGGAALLAWARGPHQLRDQRLTSVLLDGLVRTPNGARLQRMRRRLRRARQRLRRA